MNYFSVFLGTPLSGHWSRSMCFLVMFCESIGRNLCVEIPQSHPLCSTGNSNDFGICWLWNRNFLLNCGHFGVLERRWTRLFPIFSRGWAKERWGHTSTAHLHLLSMPRPGVHPQKKIRGHQLLLTKHWYAHNVIIVVSFIRFFCIPLENCLLILPLRSGDYHSHYISVLLCYYCWWCPYYHLWYSHGSHHVYLYCYLLSKCYFFISMLLM